jgi:N-acetylmuramoyl-L-alanine amidase
MQALLQGYGYGIKTSGTYDEETCQVVTAFQRHFRPAKVDGLVDQSTWITLGRLHGAC